MPYQLVYSPGEKDTVYTPRGGCKEFIYAKEHEVIAWGPRDTGKSLAGCWVMHTTGMKYPRARILLIRQTQKSVYSSILKTLYKVIEGAPVSFYGGEKPEKIMYENGSEIWIGGMDNPDRFLSSEWDLVYFNQPEEGDEAGWENLSASCSGRSAVIPYPRIMGDPNPAGTKHWILRRAQEGKLRLIKTVHQDNPTLYNEDGTLTEGGKLRLQILSNYTGVRRKRLFLGEWATAEGAVYDMFDSSIHVKERDPKEFKEFGLAIDAGYTNPAAILLIGVDEDGRFHIIREFYKTGQLQETIVKQAKEWFFNAYTPEDTKLPIKCSMIVVDEHANGLIADLRNNGLPASPAGGKVSDGISAIQNRLKVQGDGRPRLTVDYSCVNTINEFESYIWKSGKDEPVKENDHCFAGNTQVVTKKGCINISDIKVGDYVWSPLGWNKVTRSGSTGIKKVKDYGVFVSTPNHKIPTTAGIKEVDALGYSDIIMVWKNQRPYTFWEFLTAVTLIPKTEVGRFILGAVLTKTKTARRVFYTEMFGNTTMARFLMVISSIMLTAILGIMTLAILSWSVLANMLKDIIGVFGMEAKNISTKSDIFPLLGTHQKKEKSGIVKTQKSNGKINHSSKRYVKSAEKNTRLPSLIEASTVIQIAKQQPYEEEEVFNLETEWGLYFANGVLVCNCMDCVRYFDGAFAPIQLFF